MGIIETIKSALSALSSNKLRSILTMLGVIIGVFAVVLLVSLGKGVQNYITDQFNALGSNLLFIAPGKAKFGQDPAKSFTLNKLDKKHVDLINNYASEHILYVAPSIRLGNTVEYKNKKYYATIVGTNEFGDRIFDTKLNTGRFFSKVEVRAKKKVAVIGPLVKKGLFANVTGVGSSIKINGERYEVIGIFKEKSQDFDDQVIIPYTSLKDTLKLDKLSSIVVKVKSNGELDLATKQINLALLRDLKSDEFSILSQKDILSSIQNILGILTLALGAIAGISLLVGGIGIMNIMLVSAIERTSEIGLRKAVGATSLNIAVQFIAESTILSVTGGGIGLVLGWLASLAARAFLRTEVTLWAIVLSFTFSVAVGVIFGTYPAIQASKKDPIEALRYE